MILYNTEAGRIKQRILCCRKFTVIFGSSNLLTNNCLHLRLSVGSLSLASGHDRTDCILSLLSLGRFFEGILINISSKKNAFVRVFTLTILWLFAILKLDFLKSPGKCGSARPPRGMKLGNRNTVRDTYSECYEWSSLAMAFDFFILVAILQRTGDLRIN